MNLLKLKTGEQRVFDFLQNFVRVREGDMVSAIESTREHIRSNGSYKRGLFFRTLLAELDKSVDWKTAEDLENEFVEELE